MLVVSIKSLLANQMFAYAAIKALALDKGYEFKYIHEHCGALEAANSSVDKKYGRDFDTIFSIPEEEELLRLPAGLELHAESEYVKKHGSHRYDEIYEVEDNTYMDGHFICPNIFYHRIDEVRKWFAFPSDIDIDISNQMGDLRKKYAEYLFVSVHFRVGDDYRNSAYLIDASYQNLAAKTAIILSDKPIKFILFYDKKTKDVERFRKKYDAIELHGSLVEDMCAMTKCDWNIIANSSFSIMGALLNKNSSSKVFRPSIYPTGIGKRQVGSFLDEWIEIKAKASLRGILFCKFRIGNMIHRLKKIKYLNQLF